MIPKVKQKVANRNQKGTNTEPKGDQNVKNNRTGKHRPPEDEKKRFWAPPGRFGSRFGCPLDFKGVPKSIIFVYNQHKINK